MTIRSYGTLSILPSGLFYYLFVWSQAALKLAMSFLRGIRIPARPALSDPQPGTAIGIGPRKGRVLTTATGGW